MLIMLFSFTVIHNGLQFHNFAFEVTKSKLQSTVGFLFFSNLLSGSLVSCKHPHFHCMQQEHPPLTFVKLFHCKYGIN